jgi:hypothetical protein
VENQKKNLGGEFLKLNPKSKKQMKQDFLQATWIETVKQAI